MVVEGLLKLTADRQKTGQLEPKWLRMMMMMMMIRFGLQGGLVHKVAQANHYFVVRWGISGH